MTHTNLKWVYSCLGTLQTNCQMGFEIDFQNKQNATNILPELPATIFKPEIARNKRKCSPGSVLRSDCENVRSNFMKFVATKRNQIENYLISQYQLFWFGAKIPSYFILLCACIFSPLIYLSVHFTYLFYNRFTSYNVIVIALFFVFGVITPGLLAL